MLENDQANHENHELLKCRTMQIYRKGRQNSKFCDFQKTQDKVFFEGLGE